MARIGTCKCGYMTINSDLCDLCKAGHTAQESAQIRMNASLTKAKQVVRTLSEVQTNKCVAKEKTTY